MQEEFALGTPGGGHVDRFQWSREEVPRLVHESLVEQLEWSEEGEQELPELGEEETMTLCNVHNGRTSRRGSANNPQDPSPTSLFGSYHKLRWCSQQVMSDDTTPWGGFVYIQTREHLTNASNHDSLYRDRSRMEYSGSNPTHQCPIQSSDRHCNVESLDIRRVVSGLTWT